MQEIEYLKTTVDCALRPAKMNLNTFLKQYNLVGTIFHKLIALVSVGCTLVVIGFLTSGCEIMSRDSQTALGGNSMELAEHSVVSTRSTPPIDIVPPHLETATFALG
jgi:hypothetical protein